jgi:hypothetical protein
MSAARTVNWCGRWQQPQVKTGLWHECWICNCAVVICRTRVCHVLWTRGCALVFVFVSVLAPNAR